jgi:DNA replication protein DnaC
VIRGKAARGVFYDTRELLKTIRSTYNPLVQAAEMDVLRPVMEAELLVLDDLGAEKTSEWVEETLNLIVNTRYNEKRPTIFTSNYPIAEETSKHTGDEQYRAETLQERVGFRMWSRFQEMCQFIAMTGPDFRETGLDATPEELARSEQRGLQHYKKNLPARTKGPTRAQLRERVDLKWSGGKAGR